MKTLLVLLTLLCLGGLALANETNTSEVAKYLVVSDRTWEECRGLTNVTHYILGEWRRDLNVSDNVSATKLRDLYIDFMVDYLTLNDTEVPDECRNLHNHRLWAIKAYSDATWDVAELIATNNPAYEKMAKNAVFSCEHWRGEALADREILSQNNI